MLLQRQKLDMREAHLRDVVSQRLGDLTIGKRLTSVLKFPPPRSEMHFVDRKRLAKVLARGALLYPVSIAKLVSRLINDRRRVRRYLGELRVGISLKKRKVPLAMNLKLVRSEEHTSELQSLAYLVCRLLLEKKN